MASSYSHSTFVRIERHPKLFSLVKCLPFWNTDLLTVEERLKIIKFHYKNSDSAVLTFKALRAWSMRKIVFTHSLNWWILIYKTFGFNKMVVHIILPMIQLIYWDNLQKRWCPLATNNKWFDSAGLFSPWKGKSTTKNYNPSLNWRMKLSVW